MTDGPTARVPRPSRMTGSPPGVCHWTRSKGSHSGIRSVVVFRRERRCATGKFGARIFSFVLGCGLQPASTSSLDLRAELVALARFLLEVTTPPAGWSPWPAARAHWGRWGGLLEASLRTTSLNATCGGPCVAAPCQLTNAAQ